VETLAVLYGNQLQASPEMKDDLNRDFFVLSKGHAGPALYATLFLKGYITEDWLYTLNQNGTNLPSHPDKNKTPGVDMTTGSLGQGISAATGIAYGNKLAGRENYTYCIVGDGELNEGQCWEAIQFAAHRQLDHFVLFIDDNKKQLDGYTTEICNPFDFESKFAAFGFHTLKADGSSVEEINAAVATAKSLTGKPIAIILDTVKGQGVPYIEDMYSNHHLRLDDEAKAAIEATTEKIGIEIGVR
jgi:transketolase